MSEKKNKFIEIDAEAEIKELMKIVVPERASEMSQYFDKYSPLFRLGDDSTEFTINAGPFRILKFTHRTMLQIWLLGFAAWKALYSYSSTLADLHNTSPTKFDANWVNNQPGQQEADNEYNELIKAVYELANTPNLESFKWPENVPLPERGRPIGVDDEAAFELNHLATAYVFLHEIRHIIFREDGNQTTSNLDEEFKCDEFAQEIMMSHSDKYALENGYLVNAVQSKRAMGIALALFFMIVITPQEKWGGSDSHPSIADRISKMVDNLNLPDNDKFWYYLGSLLLSQLRYTGKMQKEIEFRSIKDFCYSLIASI